MIAGILCVAYFNSLSILEQKHLGPVYIIILIITLFKEDNASITYGPQLTNI